MYFLIGPKQKSRTQSESELQRVFHIWAELAVHLRVVSYFSDRRMLTRRILMISVKHSRCKILKRTRNMKDEVFHSSNSLKQCRKEEPVYKYHRTCPVHWIHVFNYASVQISRRVNSWQGKREEQKQVSFWIFSVPFNCEKPSKNSRTKIHVGYQNTRVKTLP